MGALRVVGISGNMRRPSRTRTLVDAVGSELRRLRPARFDLFDLVDLGPGLGVFSRQELPAAAEQVLRAIESADALVVGTPIYKGSYTGLFKHLFDFVDPLALTGRPVVLTATGGGRRHALAVEHQLRPLFGFFSALALPTAIYASDEDFHDGALADAVTLDRVRQAAAELALHAEPRGSSAEMTRLGQVA